MYFKNHLILIFLVYFLSSCNNPLEKTSVKNLSNPCQCVDVKLEIYKEIEVFYDKYSSVKDLEEVEMADFSRLMKLWQKNEEIDFKIGLNDWSNRIKSCLNYHQIDSLQKKMNI